MAEVSHVHRREVMNAPMNTQVSSHTDTGRLGERLHALQALLEEARATAGGVARPAQEQLKADIIALFRDADVALKEAQALKDAVKGLAEQWKQLDGGRSPSSASASASPSSAGPTRARAASARVDHLGASTFIEKGWSRLSLGDLDGAEAALFRALELAPGSNEAETLLGWTQMLQGELDTALATLQRVLARDPQHALARTNVGYVCLRQGQFEAAIEHLAAVVRQDTDRKATLYALLYLGMVHREQARYEDAERHFRSALERGPNLLQAWYELGRTYWFGGRQAEAMAAWKSGAAANKFSPWGKRCANMLVIIEGGGAPPRED